MPVIVQMLLLQLYVNTYGSLSNIDVTDVKTKAHRGNLLKV